MIRPLTFAAAGGFAVLLLGATATPQTPPPPPPPPPSPTCVVPPADFQKWFGGTVTKNGFVTFADSVGFPAPPNANACDFYKWSWQMFLWLTSPDHKYGGGTHVFDSPLFYDVSAPAPNTGKRTFIPNSPTRPHTFAVRVAQRNSKGKLVRANADGTMTEVEEGQAGGNGVLVAQSGSLVYYGIHANDVYAQFLTGQQTGKITATTFPASAADLQNVVTFAAARGVKLPDAGALVLELKTSWVELASIPPAEQGNYVTMSALVPTYDKSDPKTWKPTGPPHPAKLAMVGMHVVGTVNGHPEMVWATFEHKSNAPNGTYTYTGATNQPVTHQQSTAGKYTFCQTGASDMFNQQLAVFESATGNIVATTAQPIGPSNTLRMNPWGQMTTDPGVVANNTLILSANASVHSQLLQGDVRKHYTMIGSTWTVDGSIPQGGNPPTIRGSKTLANATMETYHQSFNCFICHNGGSFAPNGLSHIYSDIAPLAAKP